MRWHSCRGCGEGLSDALRMADVLLMFLAMLGGPILAGMGRWQVNVRWYSIALVTIPLLLLTLLVPLTLPFSSVYAPGVQIAGFAIGLAAGFFEELG
jgi:hypothetical protein